jgi:hypothetical protein
MPSDRTPGRASGRVTPAKGRASTAAPSGRYTPPIPREIRMSRPWVPWLMGMLLALGTLVIILNYLELLPYAASNWYLLGGLAGITGGFITATQWH